MESNLREIIMNNTEKKWDNTNRGVLSKNKNKTEDKHPDIKGKINVEGKDYDLAGWSKTNDKGTYYSLKISIPKPKEDAF